MKYATDDVVIQAIRDYVKSGDTLETVSKRNGVSYSCLSNWLKKAGVPTPKRYRDWGNIKRLAGI